MCLCGRVHKIEILLFRFCVHVRVDVRVRLLDVLAIDGCSRDYNNDIHFQNSCYTRINYENQEE